jgi:hypothetical protein
MAGHAANGRDYFVVGDLRRWADEGRVHRVHEGGSARLGVPSKRYNQSAALFGCWLDLYLMIAPAVDGLVPAFGLLEVGRTIAAVGLFGLAFFPG